VLTLVEARTPQGTLLSLPLDDISSGIIVKGFDGLDPVKATIVQSSLAGRDGTQFQSSRRDSRNIMIKLGLEADYIMSSITELRKQLRGFFLPKSMVSLRFYDSEGLTVDISGVVETCDAPLFTDKPTVEISIICFDSDFVEVDSVEVSNSTVSSSSESVIQYDGDIETGFIFTLNVDRDLTEFTIYNRPPDDVTYILDFAAVLQAGDVLTINTVAGSKEITLKRDGVESSLLYGMPSQSSWIQLFPGENHYRVYAEGAAIPYTISYITRHGGL
jgi:hypothetical protein